VRAEHHHHDSGDQQEVVHATLNRVESLPYRDGVNVTAAPGRR
jgi:hypothetical protein